ncbi:OmpA family protein [Rhodonellum sp.]|uniref:OmpA family protein n=1 Tax=Rhodonellum sp. TaxID=2231180 RepID=UPI002721F6C8|nr:OmpA family protein [Rhodonellum sp.]MDO9552052.1 OmpA family protein [Rhodonellum sp.]
MQKIIFSICLLTLLTGFSNAQTEYNQWSIETTAGFNKAMGPLTPGYFSPTLNIGHLDVGTRYMFNEKFGVKGDIGFGQFREAKGISPEFRTNYMRLSGQGVANLGKIMNWHSFSNKFGLLFHAGSGFSRIDYKTSRFGQFKPDYVYNIISGFTGQIKLTERLALTGDVTMVINGRQTYNLDGNEYNAPIPTTFPTPPYVHATGTWWTGTLGLNFYLGKKETHADWYIAPEKYATKEELASEIGQIKDMLKDSDGDGIPDYLDKEPNTPADARVDSSGRTVDSDGDGIPDHLDKCPFVPGPASNDGCPIDEVKEVDYFKKAINEGYVNVYFAFDSADPLGYSASATNYVANFLKKNPGVKVEIKGFADELGPENYNMKLSERRAKGVYQILISSGIDPSRLSYKGYGEDTSVEKSSADARQLARRVSFEVK